MTVPCLRQGVTAVAVAILTSALALPASGANADPSNSTGTVTASEVSVAISALGGGVLDPAAKTTSDADSAALSVAGGVAVDIPKDPAVGVTIAPQDTPDVVVGLSNAATSSAEAQALVGGTIAYPGSEGVATAVRPSASGGVQLLTVIDSAQAPTRFAYRLEIPDGGRVAITESGSAVVVTADGAPYLSVEVPWAKDADGATVPTHFEVDATGSTLTQFVEHTTSPVHYPVTADPDFGRGLRVSAYKTWNFLQCITAVGVPMGLGWAILSDVTVATLVARGVPGAVPASWGGSAARWGSWISRTCGVALR